MSPTGYQFREENIGRKEKKTQNHTFQEQVINSECLRNQTYHW
jgi:hypothetical protein